MVTGGSRGIGAAVVTALSARGDRVAALSRTGASAAGAPADVLALAADVADPTAVDAAYTAVEAQLGAPTVIVHAAGVTDDALAIRMSRERFDALVATNLGGAFTVVQRALKGLLQARTGRIVLVGSAVGLLGAPGQVGYAASKAGLVGMARSLARELGSRGITVNVVAPGPIATDMLAAVGDARLAEVQAAVPLGRVGRPEEVAAAVAFFTSAEAGYITGAVLPVDGGLAMGH